MAVRNGTVTLPQVVAPAVAAIALCVLVSSGVLKLADPEPTTGAMGGAGLPGSRLLTYSLGVSEIVVGSAALVVGGVATVLAATLYAGFTVFTFAATRRRVPLQSCGCFGREDTPPTLLHVIYNAAATGALVMTALLGRTPVDWNLPPLEILLYLGFALLGAYASFLLLTRLPQLSALVRNP